MELPESFGIPVLITFAPYDGRWYLTTFKNGIPRGVNGKCPLRECLKNLSEWSKEDDI